MYYGSHLTLKNISPQPHTHTHPQALAWDHADKDMREALMNQDVTPRLPKLFQPKETDSRISELERNFTIPLPSPLSALFTATYA